MELTVVEKGAPGLFSEALWYQNHLQVAHKFFDLTWVAPFFLVCHRRPIWKERAFVHMENQQTPRDIFIIVIRLGMMLHKVVENVLRGCWQH